MDVGAIRHLRATPGSMLPEPTYTGMHPERPPVLAAYARLRFTANTAAVFTNWMLSGLINEPLRNGGSIMDPNTAAMLVTIVAKQACAAATVLETALAEVQAYIDSPSLGLRSSAFAQYLAAHLSHWTAFCNIRACVLVAFLLCALTVFLANSLCIRPMRISRSAHSAFARVPLRCI